MSIIKNGKKYASYGFVTYLPALYRIRIGLVFMEDITEIHVSQLPKVP